MKGWRQTGQGLGGWTVGLRIGVPVDSAFDVGDGFFRSERGVDAIIGTEVAIARV